MKGQERNLVCLQLLCAQSPAEKIRGGISASNKTQSQHHLSHHENLQSALSGGHSLTDTKKNSHKEDNDNGKEDIRQGMLTVQTIEDPNHDNHSPLTINSDIPPPPPSPPFRVMAERMRLFSDFFY